MSDLPRRNLGLVELLIVFGAICLFCGGSLAKVTITQGLIHCPTAQTQSVNRGGTLDQVRPGDLEFKACCCRSETKMASDKGFGGLAWTARVEAPRYFVPIPIFLPSGAITPAPDSLTLQTAQAPPTPPPLIV